MLPVPAEVGKNINIAMGPKSMTKQEDSKTSEGARALEDIQEFSSRLTYGKLALGQGPPFSVTIRNITDDETKDKLRQILGEMGLDANQFGPGMDLGQVLVGQINEYCAIFLAHKLRDLNVDIEMGPSDSIET